MHQTTIKDIAKRLNLSIATVSRALNDKWEVSRETRELVMRTAAEMQYRPNAQARGLVSRKTRTIGVLVPDMTSSNYFTVITKHIQEELLPMGYQLLVAQSNESPEEERVLLNHFMDSNVDGMIISTSTDSEYNTDVFEEILSRKIGIVFISRVPKKTRAPKIVVDNTEMAYRIVSHLIEEGARKVVFFSGPQNILSTRDRAIGYRRALNEHGLDHDSSLIIHSGLMVQDGYEAALRMLDSKLRPDAVFAVNDNVAFGVMKALKQRHIRIPEDISVAGFSESLAAELVEPPLTSAAAPLREIGQLAARELLHQFEGFEPKNTTTVLKSELKIRDSSRKTSLRESQSGQSGNRA